MTLSIEDKIYIVDLIENDGFFNKVKLYDVKTTLLNAFILCQNQKSQRIRSVIAMYFAKKIARCLEIADGKDLNDYLGLQTFFAKSILNAKIAETFFHDLYISSKISKQAALRHNTDAFGVPLNKELNTIFKIPAHCQEAKKSFAITITNLSKWIQTYPEENFDIGTRLYLKRCVRLQTYSTIITFLASLLILANMECDNTLLYSAALAFILYNVMYIAIGAPYMFLYKSAVENIQFDINSADDIAVLNELSTADPILQMTIAKPIVTTQQSPIDVDTSFLKIKKRKVISVKADILESKEDQIMERLPPPHPGFFDTRFNGLGNLHIVLIDPENLGKNNSYYGIWHADSILKEVDANKADEMKLYRKLFSIFKLGETANKKNSTGIKLIPNLNLFEVKKAKAAARVCGQTQIKVDGKTAVIFDRYLRRGLH